MFSVWGPTDKDIPVHYCRYCNGHKHTFAQLVECIRKARNDNG